MRPSPQPTSNAVPFPGATKAANATRGGEARNLPLVHRFRDETFELANEGRNGFAARDGWCGGKGDAARQSPTPGISAKAPAALLTEQPTESSLR
jgi:hypothetical protein